MSYAVKVQLAPCPHCGHETDTVVDRGLSQIHRLPARGDLSVCESCGGISRFEDVTTEVTVKRSAASDDDIKNLPPEEIPRIRAAQAQIRAHRRKEQP